jgi:hypothetical protein
MPGGGSRPFPVQSKKAARAQASAHYLKKKAKHRKNQHFPDTGQKEKLTPVYGKGI